MEEQNEQRESILPGQEICLGRQGENLVRELRFDLSDFLESYPNGRITLVAQRNGEDLPYPAIHTRQSDRQLIWTPSDADTGKCGYGRCELRCYDGVRLAKSSVWTTYTLPALGMPGTLPDAAEDYITTMQHIGDAVHQAQKQAPKIGQNGNWWIYDAVTECYLDSGYPARGAQGPQGEQGEPGHIPLDTTLTQAGQAADAKKTGDEIGGLKSVINRLGIVNSVNGDYPILSIQDGANGGVVKSLTVSIEPVQSGSGDPSPENLRPITGWTGANVFASGKNLLGGEALRDSVMFAMPSATDNPDERFVSFSAAGKLQHDFSTLNRLDKAFSSGSRFTFVMTFRKAGGTNGLSNMVVYYTDGTYSIIPGIPSATTKATIVFTTPAGKTVDRFSKTNQVNTTQLYYDECGIFEGVLTADDFMAYQGAVISASWETEAGTVFGGTLDVPNGTLTVTHGQISSYNGETLPGAWISDRDVYTAGTTPTTGAQVVYELAEPVVYQLTPEQVETLLGVNNIWADCGSIKSVSYDADTKHYIDNKIAQALNA